MKKDFYWGFTLQNKLKIMKISFFFSFKDYLVDKYLLSICYVMASGNEDPAVNKLDKIPAFIVIYSLREDRKKS